MSSTEWVPAWKRQKTVISCRSCGAEHKIGVGRCQGCQELLVPTMTERFRLRRIAAFSALFVTAWLIMPWLIR